MFVFCMEQHTSVDLNAEDLRGSSNGDVHEELSILVNAALQRIDASTGCTEKVRMFFICTPFYL
jgi:hypothetical protein